MIASFYKTAAYIIVDQMAIERKDFEAYVDRHQLRVVSYPNACCESDAEDSRLQTWDEYYSHEYVLHDVQAYLESKTELACAYS